MVTHMPTQYKLRGPKSARKKAQEAVTRKVTQGRKKSAKLDQERVDADGSYLIMEDKAGWDLIPKLVPEGEDPLWAALFLVLQNPYVVKPKVLTKGNLVHWRGHHSS